MRWWDRREGALMEACLVQLTEVHPGLFVVGCQHAQHTAAALHEKCGYQHWCLQHTCAVPSASSFMTLTTQTSITETEYVDNASVLHSGSNCHGGKLHRTPPPCVCRCTVHYTMIILIINSVITSQPRLVCQSYHKILIHMDGWIVAAQLVHKCWGVKFLKYTNYFPVHAQI